MGNYYGVTRSDEYLAHYGVRGMKWGVRKALERGDNAALRKHYQKAARKLAKLSMNANRDVQRKRYENAKRNMAVGMTTGALGSAGLTKAVGGSWRNAGLAAGAGALGGALLNSRGISARRHISDKGHERAVQKRNEFAKEMNETFKNTGVGSNKEMRKFQQQITALSDQKDPKAYVRRQLNRAQNDTRRTGNSSPRTFNQLSAADQRRVAQGLNKLQNRFEGHYQQSISRGMTHEQAERYANDRLNKPPRKRRG